MKSVSVGLVACLASCGRIGFDPVQSDGASAMGSGDAHTPVAPAFVQDLATTTSTTVATATYKAPVIAGNLLVVALDYELPSGPTTATFSDSSNDQFSILGPYDGVLTAGTVRQYVAYAIASASGATTVTATLSGPGGNYVELRTSEYSDAFATNPVDGAASSYGGATGTDAAQSPEVTTAESNELIFGVIIDEFVSTGTGFTLRGDDYGDVVEDMVAATPGNYRATASPTGTWIATVVAFRGR